MSSQFGPLAFVFFPQQLRSLLCVWSAQTFLRFCDWRRITVSRTATAVHNKNTVVLSIQHPYIALLAHSMVLVVVRRHALCTGYEPKYHPMARRNLLRNGQATPIFKVRSLAKFDEQLPTENIYTAQITVVPAPLVLMTAMLLVSQDFGICILSFGSQVSAMCFAHRHSWIPLVQCHRLPFCGGSIRKGKLLCVHTTSLHYGPRTLRGFRGYRRHTTFTPTLPFIASRSFLWS